MKIQNKVITTHKIIFLINNINSPFEIYLEFCTTSGLTKIRTRRRSRRQYK
ncbi:hypothetical protein NEIPOLOT_02298 [Neisseria polysaccharea ATCC 43768]|nr:hypothetical protein NEIPOLOT_02298 [Neisseria polysaccharea ATCC 43768]